jgi:hypothetical protein
MRLPRPATWSTSSKRIGELENWRIGPFSPSSGNISQSANPPEIHQSFEHLSNTKNIMPGRIPASLQAVFLASNRGNKMDKPPPDSLANRVFFRPWFGKRAKKEGRNRKQQPVVKQQPTAIKPKPTEKVSQPWQFKKADLQSRERNLTISLLSSFQAPPVLSPQAFLDELLESRGYSTKVFETLKTAYHCKPTPLQQASYDVHIIRVVKMKDAETLDAFLKGGLSPNPCNSYGESIVHMVCRRGDHELLKVLIQNGCNIQVADDYGRTPLHDACWTAEPSFETVKMLLQQDRHLFYLKDSRGSLPLSYVRREQWPAWIEFLEQKKDAYFRPRNMDIDGVESDPILTMFEPNTKQMPDPFHALPVATAALVAQGKISIEAALGSKPNEEEDCDATEASESDSESDYDDSESDDDDSLSGLEDEMANMLRGIKPTRNVAVTASN